MRGISRVFMVLLLRFYADIDTAIRRELGFKIRRPPRHAAIPATRTIRPILQIFNQPSNNSSQSNPDSA